MPPQDIFRDMHRGLKDVEVKVDGFSERYRLDKCVLSSFLLAATRDSRDLKAQEDQLIIGTTGRQSAQLKTRNHVIFRT